MSGHNHNKDKHHKKNYYNQTQNMNDLKNKAYHFANNFKDKTTDSFQKGYSRSVEFAQVYGPKVKEKTVEIINKSRELAQIYVPKIRDEVSRLSKIYARKFKEAYIAFRRDYEPKIKEQATEFGNKTINFANELKKKIKK